MAESAMLVLAFGSVMLNASSNTSNLPSAVCRPVLRRYRITPGQSFGFFAMRFGRSLPTLQSTDSALRLVGAALMGTLDPNLRGIQLWPF